MPLTRAQKENIVQEIHEKAEKTKLAVFVHFRNLKVSEIEELRKSLQVAGIDFKVAKKTLLKRVLDGLGVQGEAPALEGELATAFSYNDSPEAAKIVKDFSKKHKGIKILGGILEGRYVLADFIERLAAIPSREVLLAQLMGIMSSPMRGLVGVMGGPMRNMVGVIYQLSKK